MVEMMNTTTTNQLNTFIHIVSLNDVSLKYCELSNMLNNTETTTNPVINSSWF